MRFIDTPEHLFLKSIRDSLDHIRSAYEIFPQIGSDFEKNEPNTDLSEIAKLVKIIRTNLIED